MQNNYNYYRITGYDPETDIGFIADSNGKFEKLWEFSAYLVSKGMKILEVGNQDKFKDGNLPKAQPDVKIILRTCDFGKPTIDGNKVSIKDRYYEVCR
jgi:hypothetical protein